jgi:hypothetical protein
MQPRIVERNVFAVTAAPNFNVVLQKQLTYHANRKRRRSTGDEDSHHL